MYVSVADLITMKPDILITHIAGVSYVCLPMTFCLSSLPLKVIPTGL